MASFLPLEIGPYSDDDGEISRGSFPSNFTFGVATSAYQVEGAALDDGRSMTIWDSFSHIRGNIRDASNGDIASDHYHRYKEDIQLMVDLGIDAYRFSISWARLLPNGMGQPNYDGVVFYNKLINTLIHNGIEPYVTLYHWDMLQMLENDPDIKGWRTREIIGCFEYYAETCFRLFGDRVKNWCTFNEIRSFALDGYGTGKQAPGRCSSASGSKKKNMIGDSGTEPYIVAHNCLISHANVVKIYKTRYQEEQRGRIGMSVDCKWYEPYEATPEDLSAAQRCVEFEMGWLLDPIFLGEYPESMRNGAGDRLPHFTEEELRDLKGSLDFVGVNYYTAYFAKHAKPPIVPSQRWYQTDRMATVEYIGPDGRPTGEPLGPPDTNWIFNTPWALPKLLEWMERRYGKEQMRNCPILITENGTMDKECNLPMSKAVCDWKRVEYLRDTLEQLALAIRTCGYNVQGYFVWSILDNFEWDSGMESRFGLYYVDYDHDLKRVPKKSAEWYRKFLLKSEKCSSTKPPSTKLSRGCLGRVASLYIETILKIIGSYNTTAQNILGLGYYKIKSPGPSQIKQ